MLESLLQYYLDRLETLAQPLLGEREDAPFRPVDQFVDVGLALESAAGDLG